MVPLKMAKQISVDFEKFDMQVSERSETPRHGGVAKAETYMWYARAFGDPAITQQIGLFEVYAYLRRHQEVDLLFFAVGRKRETFFRPFLFMITKELQPSFPKNYRRSPPLRAKQRLL